MIARPCLDCGVITTHGNRCPAHAQARARAKHSKTYDTARWRFRRRVVLARHRRRWGEVCPGWERKPHLAGGRNPLTVDHRIALADGGTDAWENLGVLCLECNGRKDADASLRPPRWRADGDGSGRPPGGRLLGVPSRGRPS